MLHDVAIMEAFSILQNDNLSLSLSYASIKGDAGIGVPLFLPLNYDNNYFKGMPSQIDLVQGLLDGTIINNDYLDAISIALNIKALERVLKLFSSLEIGHYY